MNLEILFGQRQSFGLFRWKSESLGGSSFGRGGSPLERTGLVSWGGRVVLPTALGVEKGFLRRPPTILLGGPFLSMNS